MDQTPKTKRPERILSQKGGGVKTETLSTKRIANPKAKHRRSSAVLVWVGYPAWWWIEFRKKKTEGWD